MNNSVYNIAFCVNDEYSSYVRVPIMSIIENYKVSSYKIEIHVLSDKISKRNASQLMMLSDILDNVSIKLHIIDDSKLKCLKTCGWPIHSWYRILLPSVLSTKIDKVLYLDVDTLIVNKLDDLFLLNMENKSIAAVTDPLSFLSKTFERCGYEYSIRYICSAIILMNLKYWRDNDLTNKIIKWAITNENKLEYPDQDAINYICKDTKIILPIKYNFMNIFVNNEKIYKKYSPMELEEALTYPIIIHYCGCAPWYKEYQRHIFHKKWQYYNFLLKNPVKSKYKAKGILLLKMIIWRIIYKRLLQYEKDTICY